MEIYLGYIIIYIYAEHSQNISLGYKNYDYLIQRFINILEVLDKKSIITIDKNF